MPTRRFLHPAVTPLAQPPFHVESFTQDEEAVLAPYFTNLDRPVFAIRGLPEVVKGALFARYSRSEKSIRRLFLDEFATDPDVGIAHIAAVDDPSGPVGLERAQALYDRVFTQYGDDSVAQLGGAHLAVEQASNILTKVLEWGRLASYLEQSTRYIFYDQHLGGRYRYQIPAELDAAGLRRSYVAQMDALFDTYSDLVRRLVAYYEALYPRQEGDSAFVWRSTIRAKACDDARGLLPASTLSNVGIFGSGQAYEALLLRMAAHPLEEVRWFGNEMLRELRAVIPSFMRRVDVPDRGGVWAKYLADNVEAVSRIATGLGLEPQPAPAVTLVDFDPDGERAVAAEALYAVSDVPDEQLRSAVAAMSEDEIDAVFDAYVGNRTNRRHKPGRAMEETSYRFDVLCDYGIFRDLQRHRMLTIEWQLLSPRHGHVTPDSVADIDALGVWDGAIARMGELHATIEQAVGPHVAQYVVPFANNIRFSMRMNAREAFHMLELRTQQGGHPDYRRICQIMHDQIRDVAGHRRIADAMTYVDHEDYELARIESERRAAAKRAAAGVADPVE
ncbi:MAG: FAD-dependent thymidylate synthase [Acidimicrobiia bacterium]|nr:FAD-dependent thymidylate synthase [Acidimicrobiia bacterium]